MALTDEGLVAVPGLLSRYVRLPDGARAHYVTAGETGPAVVLLHGGIVGSSGTAGWRLMAPFLARNGFRVYCPDLPGFGLSDPGERYRPKDLTSHVDFLEQFVDAVGLDEFHLAGNSMGCANAVNYTVAHPDRITSLALVAGFVGDVAPPQPLAHAVETPLLSFEGTEASMRSLVEKIVLRKDEIDDDVIAMRTKAALRNRDSYSAIPAAIRAYATSTGGTPGSAVRLRTKGRLDALALPMIYLFGRQDVVTPVEWGYDQEDRLPNIQYFYPEDCGHQGQTDQPEMFQAVFLEFFRDGRVSRATADWAGVSGRRPELASVVEQP